MSKLKVPHDIGIIPPEATQGSPQLEEFRQLWNETIIPTYQAKSPADRVKMLECLVAVFDWFLSHRPGKARRRRRRATQPLDPLRESLYKSAREAGVPVLEDYRAFPARRRGEG